MKFALASMLSAVVLLGACQTTTEASSMSRTEGANVQTAIEARQVEFANVEHAALEAGHFYNAVCKMTTAAQVSAYYQAQGFNMSSDGTGATAIAALEGTPFTGRMPSKAAALLRGCRGVHS